jgi:hypothetical protein
MFSIETEETLSSAPVDASLIVPMDTDGELQHRLFYPQVRSRITKKPPFGLALSLVVSLYFHIETWMATSG